MKKISEEQTGNYQTITQTLGGMTKLNENWRPTYAQQNIILQRHMPSQRIKWLFIKEIYNKDGKVRNWEYMRCHHNADNQLIFFEYTKRIKFYQEERRFKAHLIYRDNEVVGYKDDMGNEWKKRWGVPNPFDIERESQQYLKMADTALMFWECNAFFYTGVGGKIDTANEPALYLKGPR